MKRNGFQTKIALNLWIGFNFLNFVAVIFLLFMDFSWIKSGYNGLLVLIFEGVYVIGGFFVFLLLDKYLADKSYSVSRLNFNPFNFIKRFYHYISNLKIRSEKPAADDDFVMDSEWDHDDYYLKNETNIEEEYAWNKLESLESKNVNILVSPGKDGAEIDLLCPNCRKVFSIYSDTGGRAARIPGSNVCIGWLTIGIISNTPSKSMSGLCPHCRKHVSCNFDYDRMVIEIGDENQNKKEYSMQDKAESHPAVDQAPAQYSSGKDTCDECGERWKDENLSKCRVCGKTICYRCKADHQKLCRGSI